MNQNNALSVSELNEYVRRLLSSDVLLRHFEVKGEISGYKHHYSGHRYFTLKDVNAAVSCVMFRQDAMSLEFIPEDGMQVVLTCSASIYPRDGRYQLYVYEMKKCGVGDLYMQFEALKKKLSDEGLFDPARKKELPYFPRCIGIATSKTGAALRDMVRIAKRRNPNVGIVIAPCAVQGSGSEKEIAAAIEVLNRDGRPEVILCGRGGGSIEDLWAFNEELTARTIASSRIPVISCVGHETDFTIADFVADVRAATPSMAAEIAVPVADDLRKRLTDVSGRLANAAGQGNALRRSELNRLAGYLEKPKEKLIDVRRTALKTGFENFGKSWDAAVQKTRLRLEKQGARLSALDPKSVLDRGYSYVTCDGHVIDGAAEARIDMNVCIHWRDGSADARILTKEEKQNG